MQSHIYWDQATVLSQLGVLDHPLAVGAMHSAAELLRPSVAHDTVVSLLIRDDILTFAKNLNRSS